MYRVHGFPQHAVQAEARPEVGLDARLVELRVARSREQAALGGEQGAMTIDLDRAAFEDEILRLHRHAFPGAELREVSRQRIVAARFELAAPAVEAEIQVHEQLQAANQNLLVTFLATIRCAICPQNKRGSLLLKASS